MLFEPTTLAVTTWANGLRSPIRKLVTVSFLCGVILPGQPVRAQDPAIAQSSLIHWAYSATFGTGVYRVGDQEVLVLAAPISWTWRQADNQLPDARRLGVKFLFPITFGVQNFDLSMLTQDGLPERLQQMSFMPGVEVEIPVTPRWTLKAVGQMGWGTRLDEGDEMAWIYAGGIKSRFAFEIGEKSTLNLLNGLLWSGYSPDRGGRESLSELLTGVELIHPAGRWNLREEQVYLKSHLVNYTYLNEVEFLFTQGKLPSTLDSEWEIGIAVGAVSPLRIWRFRFDRIGLAYRVADNASGVRLVFSSVF